MYQVKDGKQVAPTCPECGCRLRIEKTTVEPYYAQFHYRKAGYADDRDAQGHLCSSILDPNAVLDKGSIVVI